MKILDLNNSAFYLRNFGSMSPSGSPVLLSGWPGGNSNGNLGVDANNFLNFSSTGMFYCSANGNGFRWNGSSLYPNNDNLRDLGIAATNRWRSLYLGTNAYVGGASVVLGGAVQTGFNGIQSYFSGGIGTISATEPSVANRQLNLQGHPLVFQANGAEAARIISGGNMGINTTGPSFKLDIKGPDIGAPTLRLRSPTTYSGIRLDTTNTSAGTERNWFMGSNVTAYGDFSLLQSNAPGSDPISGISRFYLSNAGNVGIGNTSPAAKLDVSGTIFSSGTPVYGIRGDANNSGLGSVYGLSVTAGTCAVGGSVPELVAGAMGIRTLVAGVCATSGYGLRVSMPSLVIGSTVSNAYALYLDQQSNTGVTVSYGIYQAGAADKNYLAGSLGLGTTSPDAKLRIDKDTATVTDEGDYAVKITDGTGDTGLLLGVNKTGHYSILQSMDPGTAWTGRPLCLMPNGGRVGIGANTNPQQTLQVDGNLAIGPQGGAAWPVFARDSAGGLKIQDYLSTGPTTTDLFKMDRSGNAAFLGGGAFGSTVSSSVATITPFTGTRGVDLLTSLCASSYNDPRPSPAIYLTSSLWASSVAVSRYMALQNQGICGLCSRYGLAVGSTDGNALAWFDGTGGFSVGALPTSAAPLVLGAGIINANTGYRINNVEAPFVPVGAILAWAKNITGSALTLPAGFVECNGGTAIINGVSVTLPTLNGTTDANKYFLRGSSSPSGTGGSSTHNHAVTFSMSYFLPGGSISVVNTLTSPTGTTAVVPPYYEVVYIIRVS